MNHLIILIVLSPMSLYSQRTNCVERQYGSGQMCWGSKPDSAQHYYVYFGDIIRMPPTKEENKQQITNINWILKNAPCIHSSFYTEARLFVKKTLDASVDRREIKAYKILLKDIDSLQKKYFP